MKNNEVQKALKDLNDFLKENPHLKPFQLYIEENLRFKSFNEKQLFLSKEMHKRLLIIKSESKKIKNLI